MKRLVAVLWIVFLPSCSLSIGKPRMTEDEKQDMRDRERARELKAQRAALLEAQKKADGEEQNSQSVKRAIDERPKEGVQRQDDIAAKRAAFEASFLAPAAAHQEQARQDECRAKFQASQPQSPLVEEDASGISLAFERDPKTVDWCKKLEMAPPQTSVRNPLDPPQAAVAAGTVPTRGITAEPALAGEKTPPIAIGTFDWATSSYSKGVCELWNSQTFSVTIGADGAATWSAFVNGDGHCTDGVLVPIHCGRRGGGVVRDVESKQRLITKWRASFGGGGTPSVSSIWECGSLRVRMPIDWVPVGSQRSSCVRLGSEPDPVAERGSELACQYSEIFTELDEGGVVLTKRGADLSFSHKGKPIILKRRKESKSPHP